MTLRLGIDLGGTKTEIAALSEETGEIILRRRIPTGRTYEDVMHGIKKLIEEAESELGEKGTIGIGMPGTISPATGLVKNANSTWLNGHPLDKDLEAFLGRPVRMSNDADCLALSEATDGAGADYDIVWAIILGTGVGSGIVTFKRQVRGPNAISGEWGHNPLPYITPEEMVAYPCYCGRSGCNEVILSGPGLEKDYLKVAGEKKSATQIAKDASDGEEAAELIMQKYEDRLARAMAAVINILDPGIIVMGGGLSHINRLYETLPRIWSKYVFSDTVETKLAKAKFGDSSGVRGAAWLWNEPC